LNVDGIFFQNVGDRSHQIWFFHQIIHELSSSEVYACMFANTKATFVPTKNALPRGSLADGFRRRRNRCLYLGEQGMKEAAVTS
jgi:hypothetical protein